MAIVGGLVLAGLLFVPVAAIRYRRSGRLTATNLIVLVAVLVYGLALWTYTLLPLPDPASIDCRVAIVQPFAFVERVRDGWTGASPADLVRNPAVLQVVLNVALFVPFGVLLRWRRRTGLATTAALGLATSLIIELTQLTGLWGLYRCAYRTFEVDDLMVNTLGAALGWAAATVVLSRRPRSRPAPTTVTAGRRLVGLACDGVTMVLVGAVAVLAWRAWLQEGRDLSPTEIDLVVQSRVQWGAALGLEALAVLGWGRTVGEWVIDVRPRSLAPRLPTLARRLVHLLVGPGLLALFAAVDAPASNAAVVVFVVAAVVAAVVIPARGLSGLVSGTHLVPAERPGSDPNRSDG